MKRSICQMSDQAVGYLREMQTLSGGLEVWACELECSRQGGRFAAEFALHNGDAWYSFYQEMMEIDDEEYPLMRVEKCICEQLLPANVPELPRLLNKEKCKSIRWTRVAAFSLPCKISFFRDRLTTYREAEDGEITYREKIADVAILLETPDVSLIIQNTSIPFLLKICRSESEMDGCDELWLYQFTEDDDYDEIKQFGEDDWHRFERKKDFLRTKVYLDDFKREAFSFEENERKNASRDLLSLKKCLTAMRKILESNNSKETHYAQKAILNMCGELEEALQSQEIRPEIFRELLRMYKSMFPAKSGLSEFYIWSDNFAERRKKNEEYEKIRQAAEEIFLWHT